MSISRMHPYKKPCRLTKPWALKSGHQTAMTTPITLITVCYEGRTQCGKVSIASVFFYMYNLNFGHKRPVGKVLCGLVRNPKAPHRRDPVSRDCLGRREIGGIIEI